MWVCCVYQSFTSRMFCFIFVDYRVPPSLSLPQQSDDEYVDFENLRTPPYSNPFTDDEEDTEEEAESDNCLQRLTQIDKNIASPVRTSPSTWRTDHTNPIGSQVFTIRKSNYVPSSETKIRNQETLERVKNKNMETIFKTQEPFEKAKSKNFARKRTKFFGKELSPYKKMHLPCGVYVPLGDKSKANQSSGSSSMTSNPFAGSSKPCSPPGEAKSPEKPVSNVHGEMVAALTKKISHYPNLTAYCDVVDIVDMKVDPHLTLSAERWKAESSPRTAEKRKAESPPRTIEKRRTESPPKTAERRQVKSSPIEKREPESPPKTTQSSLFRTSESLRVSTTDSDSANISLNAISTSTIGRTTPSAISITTNARTTPGAISVTTNARTTPGAISTTTNARTTPAPAANLSHLRHGITVIPVRFSPKVENDDNTPDGDNTEQMRPVKQFTVNVKANNEVVLKEVTVENQNLSSPAAAPPKIGSIKVKSNKDLGIGVQPVVSRLTPPRSQEIALAPTAGCGTFQPPPQRRETTAVPAAGHKAFQSPPQLREPTTTLAGHATLLPPTQLREPTATSVGHATFLPPPQSWEPTAASAKYDTSQVPQNVAPTKRSRPFLLYTNNVLQEYYNVMSKELPLIMESQSESVTKRRRMEIEKMSHPRFRELFRSSLQYMSSMIQDEGALLEEKYELVRALVRKLPVNFIKSHLSLALVKVLYHEDVSVEDAMKLADVFIAVDQVEEEMKQSTHLRVPVPPSRTAAPSAGIADPPPGSTLLGTVASQERLFKEASIPVSITQAHSVPPSASTYTSAGRDRTITGPPQPGARADPRVNATNTFSSNQTTSWNTSPQFPVRNNDPRLNTASHTGPLQTVTPEQTKQLISLLQSNVQSPQQPPPYHGRQPMSYREHKQRQLEMRQKTMSLHGLTPQPNARNSQSFYPPQHQQTIRAPTQLMFAPTQAMISQAQATVVQTQPMCATSQPPAYVDMANLQPVHGAPPTYLQSFGSAPGCPANTRMSSSFQGLRESVIQPTISNQFININVNHHTNGSNSSLLAPVSNVFDHHSLQAASSEPPLSVPYVNSSVSPPNPFGSSATSEFRDLSTPYPSDSPLADQVPIVQSTSRTPETPVECNTVVPGSESTHKIGFVSTLFSFATYSVIFWLWNQRWRGLYAKALPLGNPRFMVPYLKTGV